MRLSRYSTPLGPAEAFVKALMIAAKAVRLYPPSSSIPLETAESAVSTLRDIFTELPELRLVVGRSGVLYHERAIFPDSEIYRSFALQVHARHLAEVRFHPGTTTKEITAFLSLLNETPEKIDELGGFESRLWELGVVNISVLDDTGIPEDELRLPLGDVSMGTGGGGPGGFGPGDAGFDAAMQILTTALDSDVEPAEIRILAQAAGALRAALGGTVSDDQQARLLHGLESLAKRVDSRQLVAAYSGSGSSEESKAAARELVDSLGHVAISALLEQLAEEPDMAQRKALIELLNSIAPEHVEELGAYVSDARWYVVRNVVSILGSTRMPQILPFLQRTIRHPEARVRRETLRALSRVPDQMASEWLSVGLNDIDQQNVQIAARYLGTLRVCGAVDDLERVARGEGPGNRDTSVRIEAIDALARLAASEALPTLQTLAAKRGFMGGRNKELRSAALRAIQAIERSSGACSMDQ